MKKRRVNIFLSMVLAFSIAVLTVFPINAAPEMDETISPCYTCTENVSENLYIDNGIATIQAQYIGFEGITLCATINIKLQKKYLFLWYDVENGEPNNTWTDIVYGHNNTVSRSISVNSGTYRAEIVYIIEDSGGRSETITFKGYVY